MDWTGGFSLADVHNWVGSCLPNVPEKLPSDEEINFFFRHDRWKTALSVNYRYIIPTLSLSLYISLIDFQSISKSKNQPKRFLCFTLTSFDDIIFFF